MRYATQEYFDSIPSVPSGMYRDNMGNVLPLNMPTTPQPAPAPTTGWQTEPDAWWAQYGYPLGGSNSAPAPTVAGLDFRRSPTTGTGTTPNVTGPGMVLWDDIGWMPAGWPDNQQSPTPTTPTSPMQQQLGTGPTAPQPYTPQVGAPATTPAPNPFQPFVDAMAQYNQQITGLQQQYAGQIADYNQQYNQQAQAQTQQQTQQLADYNRQYSGQLPSAPQPTPQSAATPPAAPPQQFPGAAPQGFPGQNINPFTEALGSAGSGGFGGWNQPQRRRQPYQGYGGGGFGGRY